MLGALRRCPASLSQVIRSTSSTQITPRALLPTSSSLALRPAAFRNTIAVRAASGSARWQQRAAPRYEDEAIEAEVAQEVRAEKPPSDAAIDSAINPITKFKELEERGLVHRNVVRTITDEMKLETMTEVQSRTISAALRGTDIIAQAKTGTGKTLAFLLPVLQNIIKQDPSLATRSRYRSSASDIRALIISPTRELAEQIAEEARRLTRNTGVIVQTQVGGTLKNQALRQIQRQGCHILVGTPGRLNDVLYDQTSGIAAPKLSAFVLDEADRLLDAGFWPEIENIQRELPDRSERDRQTLMFSATVPQEVIRLVRQTLKPGFEFVKCVRDDEEPTHTRVPQKVVHVEGFENYLPTLLELCIREVEKAKSTNGRPFKAIVYFNSTADVALAGSFFHNLRGPDGRNPLAGVRVFDIHSRLTQAQRTRASDNFRAASSAILLSSDVTARGMDFPNVTHVVQVGIPSTRDTYIHRIGRTARAGKEGEGWLILSRLERQEGRRRLRDLPLVQDHSLETAKVDMGRPAQLPAQTAEVLEFTSGAIQRVPAEDKNKVYMANLGIYGWLPDRQTLIDTMNRLSKYGWGWATPPSIPSGLVQRLGLNRVRGINVGQRGETDSSSADRSSEFSRGSRDSGASRWEGRGSGGFGGDRRGRSGFGGDRDGDRRSGGGYGSGGDRRGRSSGFGDRSGGGFGGDRRGGSSFGGRSAGGAGGDRGGRSYGGDRDRAPRVRY